MALDPVAFDVAFEVVPVDGARFEIVPFGAADFFVVVALVAAFEADGCEAVDRDRFEDDALERLRFGRSFPIGRALPTAFIAPPAASLTVPAILPAVRPTVLTT